MNWLQLFWNLLGAAAIGAAGAAMMAPAGSMLDGKALGVGAIVGVVANLAGLFQRQPHVP